MREQSGARRRTIQRFYEVHEGVFGAHGAIEDFLVPDGRRAFALLSPDTRGGRKGFGFARDRPAVPFGDGDVAFTPQATESRDAMDYVPMQALCGHETGDGIESAGGRLLGNFREGMQLFPEGLGLVKALRSHLAQDRVMLGEGEGAAAFFEGIAVTFDDFVDAFAFAADHFGEQGAGGEANQIVGVGEGSRLRRNR